MGCGGVGVEGGGLEVEGGGMKLFEVVGEKVREEEVVWVVDVVIEVGGIFVVGWGVGYRVVYVVIRGGDGEGGMIGERVNVVLWVGG